MGAERLELRIIEQLTQANLRLTELVARLTPIPVIPIARSLRSTYTIAKDQLKQTNDLMAAQTITVLGTQNSVPGQLTPLAADGITVEPITTITPGSETYTLSPTGIATVATVTGTEGAFVVTRVSGQSGTVTLMYTAVNTAGTTITNTNGQPDTFIFQAPQSLVAASLAAVFGSPS